MKLFSLNNDTFSRVKGNWLINELKLKLNSLKNCR